MGFVIQTTAAQMKVMPEEFLKKSGIRYAEIGVETYNDPILKTLRKPATEKLIDEAVDKMNRTGINFIPNIVIGFPGETAETYGRTKAFLEKNSDSISHVNTYNLAVYKGTEISQKIQAKTASDVDENSPVKSFYEDPKIHEDFAKWIYDFASERLNQPEKFGAPQFMPSTSGFYSKLEQTAEEKLPNRASKNQILATLQKAGVKQNEMKWVLGDYLERNPNPIGPGLK